MQQKGRTLAMAMLFESGLGFVGVAVAWLAGVSLRDQLVVSREAVERGLIATLPMLAMLAILLLITWKPLVEVVRQVEMIVRELFEDASWFEVLLISMAAGIGEEILFRGALQPWIASWTTPWIALAVVSLLFGLAHAMTTSYFVLATLIGGYLGWLAMDYQDLVSPIVAHALYDFVAILYFQRRVTSG